MLDWTSEQRITVEKSTTEKMYILCDKEEQREMVGGRR